MTVSPNPIILAYPKSKEQSRLDLGLPLDKKIILTVGGAHKYRPFAGCEFCELVSKAISSSENIVCYGIGPTPNVGNWSKYGDRFVALGNIDYGEKYFGQEAKKDITEIVYQIIDTYKSRILNNDILEESTKQKAILKLSTMGVKMGYPDKVLISDRSAFCRTSLPTAVSCRQ